jgi:predicted nucleic acid-binding protein
MICCVDTSALLALLFEEEGAAALRDGWSAADHRIGSILLAIESLVVLRRTPTATVKLARLLRVRERERAQLLQEVHLVNVDEGILRIVSLQRELAGCRSLDAIHLATAIEVRDGGFGSEIVLASFDGPMRRLARRLKFRLLPESMPRSDGRGA